MNHDDRMSEFDRYLVEAAAEDVVKEAAPAGVTGKGLSGVLNMAKGNLAETVARVPGKVLDTAANQAAGGFIRHQIDKMTRPSLTQQVFGRQGMMPKALMLGGTAAGVAAGAEAAEEYFDRKKRGPAAMRKNLSKLYSEFPEVSENVPERDVAQYMRTLQSFNPRAAGDPLVARSWIMKNHAFRDEGIHPSDLDILTKSSPKSRGTGSAFTRAFEDITRFAN